jgi:phospholipid/cholesterol/gamma-HCH transport system ATP-binding protein
MIEVKELHKAFDSKKITKGLNLTVKDNEFIAIIGRSGEGKSVLLKQIIGLIRPDSGDVLIDGEEVTKADKEKQREIFQKCGYVFQFAALLDSLNVYENVGITMLEAGMKDKDVRPEVLDRIEKVGLKPDVLEKYPAELSGGMKKRVGLARTLMLSPKILLYDEPTTGLDPILVRQIHELIKKTHDEQNTTSVVISHDIDIFKYADTVAMLHEGKIVYSGPTKDIWECDNEYIHQFIRGLPEGPI